jgi:hypothetical protein
VIETRRDLVEKNPDLVQRFVNASIIGWYHYLYGDPRPGNALIKKQNPEMTDALLANSIAKMKQYGIVDSGDSLKLGIGAMTDATIKSFYEKMVRAGVVQAGIDYRKAYTLQFVNKGVGLDLRPKRSAKPSSPGLTGRSSGPDHDESNCECLTRARRSLGPRLHRDDSEDLWLLLPIIPSSRSAMSARHSTAAPLRSTASISTCVKANSFRCWGRPAAASRPRCASLPA